MSLPREDKLQLSIHARVNSVTAEPFGKQQSYAKIDKEYKKASDRENAANIYILVRESKTYGFVNIDYGYLKPGGGFTKGSRKFIFDVRSSQPQSLQIFINTLFQDSILRNSDTATLHILQPGSGEQLRSNNNIVVDEAKSSPIMIPAQPQVSLARSPSLFANRDLSSSPVITSQLADEKQLPPLQNRP